MCQRHDKCGPRTSGQSPTDYRDQGGPPLRLGALACPRLAAVSRRRPRSSPTAGASGADPLACAAGNAFGSPPGSPVPIGFPVLCGRGWRRGKSISRDSMTSPEWLECLRWYSQTRRASRCTCPAPSLRRTGHVPSARPRHLPSPLCPNTGTRWAPQKLCGTREDPAESERLRNSPHQEQSKPTAVLGWTGNRASAPVCLAYGEADEIDSPQKVWKRCRGKIAK